MLLRALVLTQFTSQEGLSTHIKQLGLFTGLSSDAGLVYGPRSTRAQRLTCYCGPYYSGRCVIASASPAGQRITHGPADALLCLFTGLDAQLSASLDTRDLVYELPYPNGSFHRR